MKKRILSLGVIAILILMLVTLAGCGEQTSTTSDTNNKASKNSLVSVAKVGDYVEYKTQAGNTYTAKQENTGSKKEQVFETTGEEKWQILSINDDGTVNLISEEGIATKFEKEFELIGETGFSKGVQELNNIANLYANGEHAVSGRSMKMQDIIDLIGVDNIAKLYENQYEKDLSAYTGNEKLEEAYKLEYKEYGKTYTLNDVTKTVNRGLKLNSASGKYGIEDVCNDTTIQDLLKIQILEGYQEDIRGATWLADEIIDVGIAYGEPSYFICGLGMYSFDDWCSSIGKVDLYSTDGKAKYRVNDNFIRPVIILEKDLKVKNGTGTSTDPFVLD